MVLLLHIAIYKVLADVGAYAVRDARMCVTESNSSRPAEYEEFN